MVSVNALRLQRQKGRQVDDKGDFAIGDLMGLLNISDDGASSARPVEVTDDEAAAGEQLRLG